MLFIPNQPIVDEIGQAIPSIFEDPNIINGPSGIRGGMRGGVHGGVY